MVKRLLPILVLLALLSQSAFGVVTVTINFVNCIDSYSITFFGTGQGWAQSPAVTTYNSPAGQTSGTITLTAPYSATLQDQNFHFQTHGATCNFDFNGSAAFAVPAGTADGASYVMTCDGHSCGAPVITNSVVLHTNYVASITNNMLVAAMATWTLNGTQVQQQILQPGQSATYTTPNFQTFPSPDLVNLNITMKSQTPFLGMNSDGTLGFGDVTYSGGIGGTATAPTTTYSGGAGPGGTGGTGTQTPAGGIAINGTTPVIAGNTNSITLRDCFGGCFGVHVATIRESESYGFGCFAEWARNSQFQYSEHLRANYFGD